MSKKATKFKQGSNPQRVDRENNIIFGMTLIQADREALGHDLFIDQTMIRQVTKLGKARGDVGIKARFDHPNACVSSMGTQIGYFKNFKTIGNKSTADLHLGSLAFSSPNGDMGTFLLDAAEETPDIMGNSIVFSQGEPVLFEAGEDDNPDDIRFNLPHARCANLLGCDVVDQGAATDGMFSILGRPDYLAEQAEYWAEEHPEIIKNLLEPIVNKYLDSKDIINQNQSNMSDNKKSLLTKLSELVSSEAPEVVEESTEVLEDVNLSGELEEALAFSDSQDVLIDELSSEIEANKADVVTKSELSEKVANEAIEKIESLTASNDALKAELESLKNESLGKVVEPVANTEQAVELSEEAKAEKVEADKQEGVAFWSTSQGNGDTVIKTYLNENK